MFGKRQKIILLLILLLPISVYAKDRKNILLFYSHNCKVCIKVENEVLPEIKAKYKDKVYWEEIDTADSEGLQKLISITTSYGMKRSLVPSILVGETLLVGEGPIKERLDIEIEAFLKKSPINLNFLKVDLLDIYKNFSVLAIMGSGLIDGINPCAFAVIVFFISFLSVYGYKKREVICVGTAYCLAVFITYVLIGLGFFNLFYKLSSIYFFNKVLYYFIAGFCFFMALLALYDFILFKKTGNSDDAVLQLPKFLKKRINLVIGSRLRKKKKGMWGLLISSFVIGFLVSLLESVCTGQVYLPTIVFILKNTDLKLKATGYLLLYNFMFILPLIFIFLLSILGVSSAKFNDFLKKNVGRIKFLMVLLFFGLGLLILCFS